jgi:hypothetical protein
MILKRPLVRCERPPGLRRADAGKAGIPLRLYACPVLSRLGVVQVGVVFDGWWHHTDGMGHWTRLDRWRGQLTSDEAKKSATDQCGQASWAWAFRQRTVTSRTWRVWIVHPAADDYPSGPWIHVDARNGAIRRVEHSPPADRRRRMAAGSLLVAVVVVLTAVFFFGRVCNDQVSSGKVVSACRHLQASDPPVIAMGIVILAVLGVFYSEISGFGISLKRRVDEVDQTARKGLQLAEQTQEDTQNLHETTADLGDGIRKVWGQPRGTPGPASREEAESPTTARVRDLADQYNRLRATVPSSNQRTQQMAEIVNELRRLLKEIPDFNVAEYLKSTDRGLRLAAYAYFLEHKAPQYLQELLKAVYEEDKPFGQYWALMALHQQVQTFRERLRDVDVTELSSLAQRLGPHQDRARLANDIVAAARRYRA